MSNLARGLLVPVLIGTLMVPVIAQEITIETMASPALANDDNPQTEDLSYTLYLPAGYEAAGDTRYPVLYLLHGSGGEADAWEDFWPILDTMILEGTVPPVIAVAPVTGNSYWVDSATFGAAETAVIDDLIPHIDQTLATIPDAMAGRLLAFPWAVLAPHAMVLPTPTSLPPQRCSVQPFSRPSPLLLPAPSAVARLETLTIPRAGMS